MGRTKQIRVKSDEREEWRPVKDFESHYEVSSLGRVRRIKAGRRTSVGFILSAGRVGKRSSRYAVVLLSVDGEYFVKRIHRLVSEAFLGPRPVGKTTNHKSGDRSDNRAVNLEYISQKANVRHAIKLGLFRNGYWDSATPKKEGA